MSPFKLSPSVENLKLFFTNFSDLDKRLDPLYYFSVNNLEIVNATKYPVRKLSDIITMTRGRFGHRPRNDPRFYDGEYPFIQTGDIVRANQTNGKITYSQTLNELGLKTSRLFDKPTVVITIAANIGDTAILDYPACFPDSLIGMQPKDSSIMLEYINLYFKFIKNYLNDLAPQSAQKNINYQQLSPVPIVVPPLDIQKKAVETYEKALSLKAEKEQQAKNLLSEIDTYLLGELGISTPIQDNSLEKRIFSVKLQSISNSRFDPLWYFNKNYRFERGCYTNQKLREIANIEKGSSISSSGIEAGIYPVIAGGQTSPYSHNTYNQDENVITVSASGAYAGFVWHHDYPIFASDCSVIRSKNENRISTLFLFEILKVKQKEIYFLQQGAGQPHVYPKDLALLEIPIPPFELQEKLLLKIKSIRDKAIGLQREAAQELEQAKRDVEAMILGE